MVVSSLEWWFGGLDDDGYPVEGRISKWRSEKGSRLGVLFLFHLAIALVRDGTKRVEAGLGESTERVERRLGRRGSGDEKRSRLGFL